MEYTIVMQSEIWMIFDHMDETKKLIKMTQMLLTTWMKIQLHQ